MIVPERVYYTSDRKQLVFESDPRAAYLAFIKGEDVGDLAAQQQGLDKLISSRHKTRKQEARSG